MLRDGFNSIRVASRFGRSDTAGGIVGFVVSAVVLIFAACLGPILALEHVVMRPDFVRFTKTNEQSVAKAIAHFYVAVTPDVSLPDIVRKPGNPEYKPGGGFSNFRLGVAAAYLIGGWLFFAAQMALVYWLCKAVAKRSARLWWLPVALAVVHYALPLYLMSHFSYVKYMRF